MMFGFGKKKLFEQHQKQLYQCLQFGEFALEVAKENADGDQIEFWTSKIGRLRRLTSSSLRNEGILDKNDATFALAFLEKCEEVFYQSEVSKDISFDETFTPEVGWEVFLAEIKERAS